MESFPWVPFTWTKPLLVSMRGVVPAMAEGANASTGARHAAKPTDRVQRCSIFELLRMDQLAGGAALARRGPAETGTGSPRGPDGATLPVHERTARAH